MIIQFQDFNFNRLNRNLTFSVIENEKKHNLFFELGNDEFYLSSRFVAMLVGSICGKNYDNIYIDFPVPDNYTAFLSNFTQAKIHVKDKNEILGLVFKKPVKYLLSFSGGFDSLAAYCLLKNQDYKCVSLDFGGRFKRERLFFEKFETHIVRTNLLETSLQKNHWTFMGLGFIFMSEKYSIENYIFGGIIQNSFIKFTKSSKFVNQSIGMFPLAGMKAHPIVQGLTEVGTILIILNNFSKEDVIKSLISLSNFREFKLYRKYLLLCSIDYSYYDVELMQSVMPKVKLDISLSKNLGELFLLLFIIKNYKGEFSDIDKGFIGIQENILNFVKNHNLDFYSKYNGTVYSVLDDLNINNALEENKILPYDSRDFLSFQNVTDFLSDFFE